VAKVYPRDAGRGGRWRQQFGAELSLRHAFLQSIDPSEEVRAKYIIYGIHGGLRSLGVYVLCGLLMQGLDVLDLRHQLLVASLNPVDGGLELRNLGGLGSALI